MVISSRVLRIGNGHGHARVTLDVPDLLEARDAVDQDVLAVGIDPGLGQLRRAVRHRGRQEARAGLAEQGQQAVGQVHAGSSYRVGWRGHPRSPRGGLPRPPISEHDADMAITAQSPLEASWPI